jgi:hypothetical protein
LELWGLIEGDRKNFNRFCRLAAWLVKYVQVGTYRSVATAINHAFGGTGDLEVLEFDRLLDGIPDYYRDLDR